MNFYYENSLQMIFSIKKTDFFSNKNSMISTIEMHRKLIFYNENEKWICYYNTMVNIIRVYLKSIGTKQSTSW